MTFRATRLPAADADASAWLEALNLCFPGWGGADRFDWCFRRSGAGLAPDGLFLAEGGKTVAGSGVSYRTLELTDGRSVTAAIMTGSWTLPAARGRGAFARLVQESRAAAAAQGAPILLAFVTESNASRRRLEVAGAELFPSFYCRSAGTTAGPAANFPVVDLGEATPETFREASRGRARFVYDDAEWRGQFVARPGVVRTIGRPGDFAAVVEDAADLRIQALAAAPGRESLAYALLAAHAAASGRAAFAFTTRAGRARELAREGYGIAPGFVTALPSAAHSLAAALGAAGPDSVRALLDWDFANGDRM